MTRRNFGKIEKTLFYCLDVRVYVGDLSGIFLQM